MRTSTSLLIIVIAAGMASAQTNANGASTRAMKPPAANAASVKPAQTASPVQAAKAHVVASKGKPASELPVTRKSKASLRKHVQGRQPVAVSMKAVPAEQPRKMASKGKRDPFLSIIQPHGAPSPCSSSGKQCLVVDQVVLKGVVKYAGGMVAVVENNMRKPYFLKENDPVFNGQVVKITSDSIIFREKVVDKAGREGSREIVKRLKQPA